MRERFWFCPKRLRMISYKDEIRPPTRNRFGRAPSFIQDSCDPFLSHADGKWYESKSEYRKTLKELGYEEIGNETIDTEKLQIEKELSDKKKFDETFEEHFETAWSEHTA